MGGMTWAERRVDVPLCVKPAWQREQGMLINHLRQQDSRKRQKLRCCLSYDPIQLPLSDFMLKQLIKLATITAHATVFLPEQLCKCIKSSYGSLFSFI